jgi:hypothetical protein
MDEATLGVESRMSKRVKYWKSLVLFYFKNLKITYCENSITFFPVATAVAIVFLDRIFFDFFTFQCQI